VIAHVRSLNGTHFDPRVVAAFEDLYAERDAEIDGLPDIPDSDD
jgi:HD-GYP domain-containing protein (c-di-GMP phosphodiesterase class II)